jgi:SOS-response transcriptional repressor LexA
MIPPTGRQQELLLFIKRRIDHCGVAPSFDEMAAAIGGSKGSIHRLLLELEARGHIRRLRNRKRAIEVLGSEYPKVYTTSSGTNVVYFHERVADDRYGVVEVAEWVGKGLAIWVGGMIRWKSW